MPVLTTQPFATLTRQHLAGMIKAVQMGSTVAALHGREPMKFGEGEIVTFNDLPRAEFVAEGGQKSPTPTDFDTVTVLPHKAQVTMRFNEEVQWADEDYQLGVLDAMATAGAGALARALDLGLYYRINPLTGTEIIAWSNYLNSTTNRVERATNDADADLEAAIGLLVGANVMVNGQAFAPSFSYELATVRDTLGHRLYPELGMGTGITSAFGIPAAVSDTVAGTPEVAGGTKVQAIVGDYASAIRWGIQRELPVELIRYGDPDGMGDLKRLNQVALRLEVLYAWWVDPAKFAVIEDALP